MQQYWEDITVLGRGGGGARSEQSQPGATFSRCRNFLFLCKPVVPQLPENYSLQYTHLNCIICHLHVSLGAEVAQSVLRLSYELEHRGLIPCRGRNSCLFATCVQTGSGAHPAPYSVDNRATSPGSKAAGTWSWHSPPSSAEVKNALSCNSTPPYVFMARCLIKHWVLHGVILG
jgi:hypothetical protein